VSAARPPKRPAAGPAAAVRPRTLWLVSTAAGSVTDEDDRRQTPASKTILAYKAGQ